MFSVVTWYYSWTFQWISSIKAIFECFWPLGSSLVNETPPRTRGKKPRNLVTLGMKGLQKCLSDKASWNPYCLIWIYIYIHYIHIPTFFLKWHPGGFLASTNFTLSIPLMEINNPHLTSSTPGLEACHVEDTSQASQPLNLRHVAPWLHRIDRHGQKRGEETWSLEKTGCIEKKGIFDDFCILLFLLLSLFVFFCDLGFFLWSLWIWAVLFLAILAPTSNFPQDQLPSSVSGFCLCHMMLCLRWFWCLYTSNHGSMRHTQKWILSHVFHERLCSSD